MLEGPLPGTQTSHDLIKAALGLWEAEYTYEKEVFFMEEPHQNQLVGAALEEYLEIPLLFRFL